MRKVLLCVLFFPWSLQAGIEYAAAISAKQGERALIVWQKGRIIEERYRNGGGVDRAENIYSITKSLCALGILTGAGRGLFKLDEPVSQTLTEWKSDPVKNKITVRELLSQTSGLDPGYEALYGGSLKNKNSAVLKISQRSQPGQSFAYGPAHYEALETFIARKTGQSASKWQQSTFLGPADIQPAHWRTDQRGDPFYSAGMHVTARELLKAAQITRRQGWVWVFPLISSHMIQEAMEGSDANGMYGCGFWLNRHAKHSASVERDVEEAISAGLSRADWDRACLSKKAPADLVAFVGSQGQRVYIVPSQSLIIVRLGKGSGFRDPDFLGAYFR